VGTIRKKYPDLPIHVHTHDSAGTGVASMVACAEAGADAVDAASDSMSGMTSQPSIGAILASLEGTDLDPGLNGNAVRALDTYWSQLRLLYSPFEAGLTGPDPEVYEHEIPGGQLTNLIFQASQLGLGAQWLETKKAYEQANDLLGDIVKVTPTSKVVGDMAQFMVTNKLSYEDEQKKAKEVDNMTLVGDVDGKIAILVDDMADTCGTLKLAAETLQKKGAKQIYALCSHGVLSGKAVERVIDSPLSELVVTNSIQLSEASKHCDKIKVIDVSSMLAEAIRRTHNGESISVLFAD